MEGAKSRSRHLVTPNRADSTPPRRSRSRTRRGSGHRRSRDSESRDSESRNRDDRLRTMERELEKERERLRCIQENLDKERRRVSHNVSHLRESNRQSHRSTTSTRDSTSKRQRSNDGRDDGSDSPERQKRRVENNQQTKKSTTPPLLSKDVIDIVNSLKVLQSQPSTSATLSSNNHKNILPDFDPSSKNQRIDVWIKKVNECATVYGWDDKTTIHFAMQKLQGLAKVWYESLPSILFNWVEWQQKLLSAFPCEKNYGQTLEDMLKRKSKPNEPIEVYYYEKLALLNQCSIDGKRAVECIIHGLTDRTMKSSAITLRCSNPEQLLQFFMSSKESSQIDERLNYKFRPRSDFSLNRSNNRNKLADKLAPNQSNPDIFCYNCREKGHPYSKCPKPITKCSKCNRMGHKAETCRVSGNEKTDFPSKTMCVFNNKPSSKFYKSVFVNDVKFNGFVDFGSEVSLIKQSSALSLGLSYNDQPTILKGFGNEMVRTLGSVLVKLCVDGVVADVDCQVVEDQYLDQPILIGQTFTEQAYVAVYKTANELRFMDIRHEMPFSDSDIQNDALVQITTVADMHLYGPACVKTAVTPTTSGYVLVESKVIGKLSRQFFVLGGVYPVKNQNVYISVSPVSLDCSIDVGMVISRGSSVRLVNRIMTPSVECPVKRLDESNIHVGENVDHKQRQKLLELLNKYQHCFASSLKDLGCTDVTEMTIEVNSNKPVVYRPYRLSHKEREKVRDMVSEMLDAGIVRESVSEYASPIILVRKKDGNLRLCVDYRMLNSVTVKERYPMPNIDDEIARLSGQTFFVTLDLTSGYYQVPIAEQSRPLTSFVTPDGQFEFNRMPFGLANAPAVFQRMMNRVLGPARYNGATAYIDDVLIYGSDIEECLSRLENVLQLIDGANLTLNLSKCKFLMNKIDYLGYEISASGVQPGSKKIKCVQDFPCPSNQHMVRQFLGLVGYFRKFVKNFASIADPLTKLLAKGAEWTWTNDQENAFKTLKDMLVDRPILAIYNPAAETELHTDASKLGVGGVLLQKSGDVFKPVAFYSRKTSPEEKHFHAYELETLAVVRALKKFRVYLLGLNFKIVTDCSALRSTFSKRDVLPRVARWWLLMQEFQCTVEYRAGTKMAHVDALSRNAIADEETSSALEHYPSVMSITNEDWLHTLQLGDAELCRIRDVLQSDMDADKLKYIKDNYLIKDNKLYRYLDGDRNNIRWVVPKGARWQLCRINHDDIGHFGVEKTLERLKKTYWFAKMTTFVKKYVKACIECAYAKKSKPSKEGHLHSIEKVDVPFHTIHIDHLGPFVKSKRGNTHLLVVVDGFTKFTFVKPARNTKTQSAVRILEDIFYTFRVPDRIISDRGTCFTSHAFKRFCLDKGIKHVLNAVASPRSNGQVERYNRTILNSLTAQNLNRDEREWDDAVGKVQWGINNTYQKTTGKTPVEILFGTCMNSELNPKLNAVRQNTRESCDLTHIREQAKDAIDCDQEKQRLNFNKNRRPARVYAEGELVKITKTAFTNDGKSKKLLASYIGPFRVVAVLGNDRYRVAAIPGLTGTKSKRPTTVAADRMLPWVNVAALQVHESESDDDNESDDSKSV